MRKSLFSTETLKGPDRVSILSFQLDSERLDELPVFRAVGKKDFHTVVPAGDSARVPG